MLGLKRNDYEESSSHTLVSMMLRDCVAEESRTPRKASNSIQQEKENMEREREREDGQSVIEIFRDKRKRYGV
jgi:hypothetical protein